jgi:hypothetical protein
MESGAAMTNRTQCSLVWLLTILIALVISVIMPMRDEEARNEAERQFYVECNPKYDNERVIVERHAGSWECHERHQILTYGQGSRK